MPHFHVFALLKSYDLGDIIFIIEKHWWKWASNCAFQNNLCN